VCARKALEGEQRRQQTAKVIYAPKSIRDFKQKLSTIERHDPTLWASPVDAFDQPIIFGLYEELVGAHGLSQARGAIATLSIAVSWAASAASFPSHPTRASILPRVSA
jgi:hypothetical protein